MHIRRDVTLRSLQMCIKQVQVGTTYLTQVNLGVQQALATRGISQKRWILKAIELTRFDWQARYD